MKFPTLIPNLKKKVKAKRDIINKRGDCKILEIGIAFYLNLIRKKTINSKNKNRIYAT